MQNRIREIRESKGLSGEALGKKIGVGRAMISKLEKGQAKITQQYLEKLTSILGVTSDEIIGKGETRSNSDVIRHHPAIKTAHHSDINPVRGDLMPVYGPVGASPDDRIPLTEEAIMDWKERPEYLKNVKGAFWMYVRGESMLPRYEHGELVAVHPRLPPDVGQDCVIVDDDGGARLKRYLGETDTDWKFKQFNPEQTFKIKKADSVKIYAVLGSRRI